MRHGCLVVEGANDAPDAVISFPQPRKSLVPAARDRRSLGHFLAAILCIQGNAVKRSQRFLEKFSMMNRPRARLRSGDQMVIGLVPAQLALEGGEAGVGVDGGQLDPRHVGEIGQDLEIDVQAETGVM